MSDFGTRTVMAVIMIAVALGLTWLGGYYFAVFAALVAVALFYEWRKIAEGGASAGRSPASFTRLSRRLPCCGYGTAHRRAWRDTHSGG